MAKLYRENEKEVKKGYLDYIDFISMRGDAFLKACDLEWLVYDAISVLFTGKNIPTKKFREMKLGWARDGKYGPFGEKDPSSCVKVEDLQKAALNKSKKKKGK